jgi:RNA ligase (TIGR02306 family)
LSTLSCPVIRLGKFADNPNSDSLCVFNGPQGPLQFKKGDLKEGDLVCFIPADSMVPVVRPEFAFLSKQAGNDGYARVRGIKLRGIPSVGLLIRCPDGFVGNGLSVKLEPGMDLSLYYGIKKYEPPKTHSFHTDSTAAEPPGGLSVSPTYDIENNWFFEGAKDQFVKEDVKYYYCDWFVTEKIHGCNTRLYMDQHGKVHVGSRNRWVNPGNVWHQAYEKYKVVLDELMKKNPQTIFFGEVYGKVQDLTYGVDGIDFRLFDAYDVVSNRYWSPHALMSELAQIVNGLELYVPVIGKFTGKYEDVLEACKSMCNGVSMIDGKTIREGVVLRPHNHDTIILGHKGVGRFITKVINPDYLSRNNGTEFQ